MRGEQYSIGALSLIVCVISNTLLVLQHPKGTAYDIFYVFLSCDQARRPPHEAWQGDAHVQRHIFANTVSPRYDTPQSGHRLACTKFEFA